jgi:hypothetical protein
MILSLAASQESETLVDTARHLVYPRGSAVFALPGVAMGLVAEFGLRGRRFCWQLVAGLAVEAAVVQTPDSTEMNSVAVVDGGCSPPGLPRWFSGVFATRRGEGIGGGDWIALAEVLLAVGCCFGCGGRGSADT